MPEDIAILTQALKQELQPYQITVKTSVREQTLKIVLTSQAITDQSTLIYLMMEKIYSLPISSVNKVKIHCHRQLISDNSKKSYIGTVYNIWQHEVEITPPSINKKIESNLLGNINDNTEPRLSEGELKGILQQCSQTAEKTYHVNLKYIQELKQILQTLEQKTLLPIKSSQVEFVEVTQKITTDIKTIYQQDLQELVKLLQTQKEHLTDFTVALFGRTKAGKSTIREALTRGDGSSIGKGTQRTTRDVHEYRWQGLRLLDTPGIEAYHGEEDTAKANDIIEQSDLILFLVSDESVQPGEFKAMAQLNNSNKYFAVILNVKENIEKPKRLSRFLHKPDKVFNESRLKEHHHHIRTHVQQDLQIDHVDIITIHAMAAFLSTKPEHQEYSEQLWQLSKIEELYHFIAKDIQNHGNHRRVTTFFAGTRQYIAQIEAKLLNCEQLIQEQVKFLKSKKRETEIIFNDLLKDSQLTSQNKISQIYSQLKQQIPYLVDNYAGREEAEREWKKMINNHQNKQKNMLENLTQEILADLKERLQELEKEYNYDLKDLKFSWNNVKFDDINPNQFGDFLKNSGLLLSGLATAAFIAATWWNPLGWVAAAGWISTGLSIVTGFASGKVKHDERREFNQKREQLKNKLINQIDKQQKVTIKNYHHWLHKEINKIKDNRLVIFSDSIKTLRCLLDSFQKTSTEINNLHNRLQAEHNYIFGG